MANWPLLSILIWLPILGGSLVLALGNARAAAARWLALGTALLTFLASLPLLVYFQWNNPGLQYQELHAWIPAFKINYALGVDGIAVALVLLTTLITVLTLIGAWSSVTKRVSQYVAAFLILEGVTVGIFAATDAMLFYVFFEAMLIPMFLIIGVWGGPRRIYAAVKFFLYTFLGSVLMLVGLIYLYLKGGSFQFADLYALPLTMQEQTWIFFAFLIAFAVKVPMFPVHTWLPDAHVEAPTAGSVVLAAILLKMGGYGFLRFSLPMFPLASADFAPLIFTLSVVAIVYTSLVALMQEDIKKLIAYSSVAHMGYVTMGIFAMNQEGIEGGIFQMLSHGLVSGALFLCVGVVYDRMHTREIAAYGGLVNNMPKYAVVFLIFTMANVGLPGTSGFIGEFLTLLGVFKVNTWVAFFAATGIVLSAAYALWLYRRVIFGALTKESLKGLLDLSTREKAVIYPLVILVIFFGVYPAPVFNVTAASVEALVNNVTVSIEAANSGMSTALAQ